MLALNSLNLNDLTGLRSLQLQGNHLKNVPYPILEKLPMIERINLVGNPMEEEFIEKFNTLLRLTNSEFTIQTDLIHYGPLIQKKQSSLTYEMS